MGYEATAALAGALQGQEPAFRGTYLWLAAGGVLLALAVLAFAYLLVRRHAGWFGRLLHHPALRFIDRRLSAHAPGAWRFVRRRFTVRAWHGLALTAALCVAFAMFYAFALITEGWTDQEALYAFDRQVYGWLVRSTEGRGVRFLRVVTHLGDGLTITVLSLALGAVLLYRRQRWRVVALVLATGVGSALMWGLKWIFGRDRPAEQLAGSLGHSFPSGHAFGAVVFYGFLIYLVWRTVRSDAARLALTFALVLVIVTVGLSRIVLRVHWVSDVAGGFTVGLAWLVCSLVLTRALRAYRSPGGKA